ncbi:hypothetical protein FACS1894132_05570 [Clostridia bacterium]|nr:hypothetical protein FACS1894132_05570 [Clostridia bacterium]
MLINVLELWNAIGTLSFAACGVMVAWSVVGSKDTLKGKMKFAVGGFIGAMLTGWGGGAFGRDVFVRGRKLTEVDAINADNLPLFIATAVFAASLIAVMLALRKYSKNKHARKVNAFLKLLRLHGDSLGCIAFGIFGFAKSRGIWVDYPLLSAVVGSWITICGGGILAAFTRSFIKDGKFTEKILYFPNALKSNVRYYLFGCMVTFTFGVLTLLGAGDGLAALLITPLALLMGVWADKK